LQKVPAFLSLVMVMIAATPVNAQSGMGSMPGMQMATPQPKPARSTKPVPNPATTPSASSSLVPPATPTPNGLPSAAVGEASPAAQMDPGMVMPTAVRAEPDPMSQEGSGTSWLPKSTQMFGWMQMHGSDMTMEHGAIFPRYVDTGSLRGDRRADAPNWFMAMGTHALGTRAQIGIVTMLSADTLTENTSGYPLLFQTGETAYGAPLHDHQHPHDLFAELALDGSLRIGKSASAYVYVGYPGEPALGPPAFMHRRIAYDLADAPIGHHWMDSSHIQFGVATVGFAPNTRLKVEASTFTGREPDEIRTNLDPIHIDSYSQRVSWNPNDNAAIQVSYGYIKSPEASDPAEDQHRLTASVLLNTNIAADHNWYTGIMFGQNVESSGVRTISYLAETDYQAGRNTVFARLELGTRTAADLVIPFVAPDTAYNVGSYTLGGVHDLSANSVAVNFGIGAALTLGSKSASLNSVYGAYTPIGFQLFFRVRPPDMANALSAMSAMSMGGH
jgi:hypothetical protein